MIHRLQFAGILGIVLVLVFTKTVYAHNTQPRLEINMERQIPGGVVDVRGVAFGMEETVTLALIGSGLEVSLGEMITDADGEFIHIAVLPIDLAEGTYYFRAVTSHHYVISPPLTVWGTAITEGGGQGPRDEDDGLLAPMPTYPPATPVAQAISTVSVPVASVPVVAPATLSGWGTNILILAVLMAVAAVVILRLRRERVE